MADAVWTIEMLGWLRASRGTAVARPLSQKAATLLAYLALHPDTAHSREELAVLLWPEADGAAGRHNLRTRLYEVRRVLEPPGTSPGSVLATDRDLARLVPGSFTTDVAEFNRAADTAVRAASGERVDALERALGLYRGELLAGFFDSWILAERRRLASLQADLLARLLDALSSAGRTSEAVDVAHRLIACDPLDEGAHLSLMRLYAAEGRTGAALEQYRAFVAVLRAELGVEPSEEAQAFVRGLGPASARAAAPAGPAPPRPAGIPAPLTAFVGREEELARLRALLIDGGARLVTIAGPGGIGKTRLAGELGRIAEREAGATVVFVELADVVDGTFVADSIASAAGLRTPDGGSVLDAVASALDGEPRPLLLVDNAEQVAEAAAETVRRLLDRVPSLGVLVTSRQPLGISGEIELRLGPLPTPSDWEHAEELARNPSVALYVDRVRAKRSDFRLTEANAAAVARLCSKLEGIPLALELAAVRERVLPASQLIARLERRFEVLSSAQRDVPERHRTLSAAIDWSYHALDAATRRAFARLSVFRGGWALEEGEAICASPEAVDALDRMCEVSLVEVQERAGSRRFRMLETIREFAAEQVPPEERDELRRRHARLFLTLAERAQVYLTGPEQATWYERIDAEFENFRAALDRSLRAGDAVTVVRIVIALNRYWPARSRRREARRWLHGAFERGAERIPRRLMGRGLRFAADLAFDDGDLGVAKECLERALTHFDGEDDPHTVASILSGLGHVAARHDDFETARELLLRGAEIAASQPSLDLRATLANDLGVLAARTRDYERALEHFSESLEIYRDIGDDTSIVVLLYNLGYLATILRRFDEAEAFLAESLATSRRLGHGSGHASAATFLGLLAFRRGSFDESIARCREAVDLCLDVGERHRLVLAVECLGLALAEQLRDDAALLALGHAEALREETETEALLEEPELRRGAIAALEARAGADEAERLLAAGRAASTERIRAACDGESV